MASFIKNYISTLPIVREESIKENMQRTKFTCVLMVYNPPVYHFENVPYYYRCVGDITDMFAWVLSGKYYPTYRPFQIYVLYITINRCHLYPCIYMTV